MTLLCEQQGLDYETIARLIYRFEHPDKGDSCRSLEFDVADRLLCGAGLFNLWWHELAEYYERVDLSWKKCECEGCATVFQMKTDSIGRHVAQKYCSPQCSRAAYKIRQGRTQQRLARTRRGEIGRPVGTIERKCRKGHLYTPENIVLRKNGKRECRICKRIANNASHARRQAECAA